MLGLILQGLIGRLGRAQAVQDFAFSRLDIDLPGRRQVRIAIDGERIRLPLPLRVEVAPRPLWLLGARGRREPSAAPVRPAHFGTELPACVGALERLVACVRRMCWCSRATSPSARPPRSSPARRDWLARLPVPHRLVIGGNHDIPLFDLAERLRHPYRRLSAAFGPEREPRLDLPGWRVLALDTTRWWRHRDGALAHADRAHRRRAAGGRARARSASSSPTIRCMSPAVATRCTARRITAGALSAWAGAGADLLLSGHIHLPAVVAGGGRTAARAPGRRADRRAGSEHQAGTAISRRLREGIRTP